MARLTKDERDRIREDYADDDYAYGMSSYDHMTNVYDLLDSLDVAEAENKRLRILARSLYSRAVDGDDFADNDLTELRAFKLIDDDGFPVYDDEE